MRAERGEDVVIMLVGNKTDLDDIRQVTEEEGQSKATDTGCLFMEVSAKGVNIKQMFRALATKLPGVDAVRRRQAAIVSVYTVVPVIHRCSFPWTLTLFFFCVLLLFLL